MKQLFGLFIFGFLISVYINNCISEIILYGYLFVATNMAFKPFVILIRSSASTNFANYKKIWIVAMASTVMIEYCGNFTCYKWHTIASAHFTAVNHFDISHFFKFTHGSPNRKQKTDVCPNTHERYPSLLRVESERETNQVPINAPITAGQSVTELRSVTRRHFDRSLLSKNTLLTKKLQNKTVNIL